ncbi:MAG: preprotein translocase subunit SecG [Thermodesulfobacteriota bacterium]|nr:preprotein translocase subunit SecG [Thermodesulfobacteriota bacterium]
MILTVLLQTGKGADMGAAFGGSSQTVFGSSGPGTFLGKVTTFIAIFFMLTSLWLAYSSTHKVSSLMEDFSAPGVERTIPVDEGGKALPGSAVPSQEQTPVKDTAD